jgi:hypothetical protein
VVTAAGWRLITLAPIDQEMHHAIVTCRAAIGTILAFCLVGMTTAQPNAVPVRSRALR